MATNLLQLLAADQAVSFATAVALSNPDLEALINGILPSNNQGAIYAEQQRKLMFYALLSRLGFADVAQTYTGGEATKVLSAAGGKAIADSVASQIAAAVAGLKSDLLGGVGPAYDTLKELADLEISEQGQINQILSAIGAMQQQLTGLVKADGSTPMTGPLTVPDATANGQAVTLRQMGSGVQFGVSSLVNLLATGTYSMGTTKATDTGAAAQFFVLRNIFLCARQTSGTVISASVIAVGTNSPAYDNIYKGALLTIPPVGENIPLPVHAISIPAGTPVFARVLTAQVGGTGAYDIFGEGFYHTPAS